MLKSLWQGCTARWICLAGSRPFSSTRSLPMPATDLAQTPFPACNRPSLRNLTKKYHSPDNQNLMTRHPESARPLHHFCGDCSAIKTLGRETLLATDCITCAQPGCSNLMEVSFRLEITHASSPWPVFEKRNMEAELSWAGLLTHNTTDERGGGV